MSDDISCVVVYLRPDYAKETPQAVTVTESKSMDSKSDQRPPKTDRVASSSDSEVDGVSAGVRRSHRASVLSWARHARAQNLDPGNDDSDGDVGGVIKVSAAATAAAAARELAYGGRR
jgi:hypothetical protein